MIEKGLREWILANAALQDVLPSSNQIFHSFVPESANYPCIEFHKISGEHDQTFQGPSGFVTRRYQFTAYGVDATNGPGSGYVSAEIVADTLRQQFEWMSENCPMTLPDGTYVFDVQVDNELDSFDDQGLKYHCIKDYMIQFRQNP